MSASELQRLEKSIQRLRQQLAGKRDTLATIAPEEKERIKQQIEDLREEIRNFEQQKEECITKMKASISITDIEVQPIIAEIVTEVEAIAIQPPDDIPEVVLTLLQQILAKLNEPGLPAAAKLKGAISTLPPFVSLTYEAELDTENTFRKYFPTFSRWLREVKERLKK